MPLIETALLYIADKILAQIIKEDVWTNRIKYFFFPPKTYKSQLTNIIYETIEEYEKSYPYNVSDGKLPFYELPIFFEHLLMFVLFKKGSLETIKEDLRNSPQISLPAQKQLDEFFAIFSIKVSEDKILKSKFIDETYKEQIYEVTKTIEEIKTVVTSIKDDTSITRSIVEVLFAENESKKLTSGKIKAALNSQVNRQLKKQINSGKYLQNTFIETNEQKDNLRYLCDSVFFSQKCFEEISVMDFRLLNKYLKKENQELFNLDFEKFNPTITEMTVSNSQYLVSDWHTHLIGKKQEIVDIQISSNEKSKFEYKFRDRTDDLSFLKARVALITETAGQGKTNFLCDFAENFLLKRQIPTLFLTGAELNSSDIRNSILQRIFPDTTEISFEETLQRLKELCDGQKTFFVLIIDGINENVNAKVFGQTLETFIAELLEHDFVKVVISCRTEYYHENFQNLEKSSFSEQIKRISTLLGHRPDDNIKKKLFHVYFNHFKIEYQNISDKAYGQLVDNFLLLRIYCEAYQNQSVAFIDNIYKEELFEKYYTLKCEEINKRLSENDEFKIKGTFDIRNFITNVIKSMIETREYVNVPFDKIVEDPKDREMYIRFLDENILVKRDMQTDEKGFFTTSEVVNFTFDEFRDFMISRYLVEKLYPSSPKEFSDFLESEITEKSPLLEGCSTFLFYISRRGSDKTLNQIISNQPWFKDTFSTCIFTLKDSQVTDDDKSLLKANIMADSGNNDSIIYSLISRYNTDQYKILNIDFLFELLRELNKDLYDKCFVSKFGNGKWGEYSKITQVDLISQINDILEEREFIEPSPYHKIFELLIYMFTNHENWRIQSLYEKYYFKHNEIAKTQLRKALESKNENLIGELILFIKEYEISL